jgi:hypothetical protein
MVTYADVLRQSFPAKFTAFSSSFVSTSAGHFNVFDLKFTLPSVLPTDSALVLILPTEFVDVAGNTAAYTAKGHSFKPGAFCGYSLSPGVAAANCRVMYSTSGQYSRFVITQAGALPAATQHSLLVAVIKNPAAGIPITYTMAIESYTADGKPL